MKFTAASEIIASVQVKLTNGNIMFITQVYAPTSMSSEEELDNFYNDLQITMPHDKSQFKMTMGDFNTTVGEGNGKDVWGNLDTEIEMKEMTLSTLLSSITSRLLTATFRRKKHEDKMDVQKSQLRNSQRSRLYSNQQRRHCRRHPSA